MHFTRRTGDRRPAGLGIGVWGLVRPGSAWVTPLSVSENPLGLVGVGGIMAGWSVGVSDGRGVAPISDAWHKHKEVEG